MDSNATDTTGILSVISIDEIIKFLKYIKDHGYDGSADNSGIGMS